MFRRLFGRTQPDPELLVADRAFRDSVLLMKLLEATGTTPRSVDELVKASATWRRGVNHQLNATGLCLLRFLFKSMHVRYDKALHDEVIHFFVSANSQASRLSALDVLGAMATTPNPMQLLPTREQEQLLTFRAALLVELNTAQRAYTSAGVSADLARVLTGSSPAEAVTATIARLSGSPQEPA